MGIIVSQYICHAYNHFVVYGMVVYISPWAKATQMYQFEGPTESGTDLKLVRR